MRPPVAREPAIRLTKARMAAGFSSGRAAAAKLQWSLGTYAGDEAAARALSPERIAMYARRFRVPEDWLSCGSLPMADDRSPAAMRIRLLDSVPLEDVPAVFVGFDGIATAATGAEDRLREARLAAGFETAAAACDRYGWKRHTYYTHEDGTIGIRSDHVRIYAFAFGADAEWLMLGPYLGREPERRAGALPSPEEAREFGLERRPRPPTEQKARPRRDTEVTGGALSGRASDPGDVDAGNSGASAVIDRLSSELGKLTLAVAAEVPEGGRIIVGDHVWIDTVGKGPTTSGYLAYSIGPGKVRVVEGDGARHEQAMGTVRGVVFGDP